MKKLFYAMDILFTEFRNVTLKKLSKILLEKGLVISTAESCTGGLVSSRLTDISGSSAYIKANFVTYANEAKEEILGVSNETLKKYGAVSPQCAKEMAEGLMARTGCDVAVCTTGIAGPTGYTIEKPVGLVYVSVKYKETLVIKEFRLNPKLDRKYMKFQFSQKALETVLNVIK